MMRGLHGYLPMYTLADVHPCFIYYKFKHKASVLASLFSCFSLCWRYQRWSLPILRNLGVTGFQGAVTDLWHAEDQPFSL